VASAVAAPGPAVKLRATGLSKRYDDLEVLANLDLELQAGECFGLLGPNGAGKTTTLRLCLGHTDPDGGVIEVLGFPVPASARQARARIGVVPQSDNLDPDFTVYENLLVFARYFGQDDATTKRRIPELLDFAGLTGRGGMKIQALSGGMKRRLALARALVNDPDLLFLDEPTTGLDPQARHLIWDRLKRLTAEGKTLLLTTHFMDEAERLCHRIAVLDQGRLIATGTPQELVARHIEPQVVEVYGDGVEDWARDCGRHHSERCEQTGETVFCYLRQAEPLIVTLREWPQLRYLHRPANLEDVFLKLTGRELRD
jgi:lipooligosaccharide transport system ATP-binding protein